MSGPRVRVVTSFFGSGAMLKTQETERVRGRTCYFFDASQYDKLAFVMPGMRAVFREKVGTAEVVLLDNPQFLNDESAKAFAATFPDKEIVVFCRDKTDVPPALRDLAFPSSLKNALRSEVETMDAMVMTTSHLSQIRNKCLELLALLETEGQ